MAEWLCSGLQSRVPRFDSGSRLQKIIAAVAQLVERNLAKVEVESSRLFCRSRHKRESVAMRFPSLFYTVAYNPPSSARMVKLVDTRDLKSLAARRTGSIPVPGTSRFIPFAHDHF